MSKLQAGGETPGGAAPYRKNPDGVQQFLKDRPRSDISQFLLDSTRHPTQKSSEP